MEIKGMKIFLAIVQLPFKGVLLVFIEIVLIFILFVSLIWRIIATILIKIEFDDTEMLSSTDAVMAQAEVIGQNPCVLSALMKGRVDIEYMRSVLERVVKENPRCQHTIEEKYGYYFWKRVQHFDIKDYVYLVDNESISTLEEWGQFELKLFRKSIPKSMSPWSMYCVILNSDYEEIDDPEKFYLSFTFYHGLGDGYSIFKTILLALADESAISEILTPRLTPVIPMWKRILQHATAAIVAPYLILECFFKRRKLLDSRLQVGDIIHSSTGIIDIESIKSVKTAAKVSFKTVLFSCILRATELFYRNRKFSNIDELTVVLAQTAWKPDEPVTIRNKFFALPLTFPAFHKSCKERLKSVDNVLNSFYTRNMYFLIQDTTMILGSTLPKCVKSYLSDRMRSAAAVSLGGVADISQINTGSFQPVGILRRAIPISYNIGILLQFFSVGNTVELTVSSHSVLNNSIVTKDELSKFHQYFCEELEELKKSYK